MSISLRACASGSRSLGGTTGYVWGRLAFRSNGGIRNRLGLSYTQNPALKFHTFQIPSPRKLTAGLRIGTVRFLSRGVQKKDYARLDYFDVWLPSIAPS